MKKTFCLLLLIFTSFLHAHLPSPKECVIHSERMEKLEIEGALKPPHCIAVPEEAFVYVFNPTIIPWIKEPLNAERISSIRQQLNSFLAIPLTNEGFTQASSKAKNETNYDAVWVRDSCWHYFGLKLQDPQKARKLLLNLLRFYSSKDQINRFLAIIEHPEYADPSQTHDAAMRVPLIRFSSSTLFHQQVNGKDQPWNHIQFDSHGLFLLALANAIEERTITYNDLKEEQRFVLALFPAFFGETHYAQKGDAGPWEEDYLHNASSAGLIAGGLAKLSCILPKLNYQIPQSLSPKLQKTITEYLEPQKLQQLVDSGYERVSRNLALAGETADRGPDAALLFLCAFKSAPFYGDAKITKQILTILQPLVGLYGIYRYQYDAYQTLNYWTSEKQSSAIEGTNLLKQFVTRFDKGYMPHEHFYDAQWFFDSYFAIAYYRLAKGNPYYRNKGDIHLKRALGQLTGPRMYAANGEVVEEFRLPESINSYRGRNGTIYPVSSPIVPLLWSNAALEMALESALEAHQCY